MSIGLSNTYGLYTTMSNGLYSGTVGGGSGSSGGGGTEAFRNLIINGAFIVDQKNEGLSNSTSNNGIYAGPDRFFFHSTTTTLPRYTVQRIAQSDADNSLTLQNFALRMRATSNVDFSAGSDYAGLFHGIEGNVTAPLRWGTANGLSASLSFYCKTNFVGTHWVSMRSGTGAPYTYVFPFTMSTADTYTRITKTIPAPPANSTWYNDSNVGLLLRFDVYQSSSVSTANNQWISGNYTCPLGTTSASNMWATSNNYVELAGIQLEAGSSPSDFEYRPFTTELKLCQRYYEKSHPEGIAPLTTNIVPFSAPGNAVYMFGSNSANQIPFTTTKRANPTMTFFNPYSSNGNCATDTVYSSNLAVYVPNINRFGVGSTESNLWNRNVYFNWAANSDYY